MAEIIEDYRNLRIKSNETEIELLINFEKLSFEFSSPGQDSLISLKTNKIQNIKDTIECLQTGLGYIIGLSDSKY